MNETTKAKIETIRTMSNGESFTVQVSFPEFTGPAGDPITHTFETTLQAYQDWECPGEVEKNPETYIEYKYVRAAYTKLEAIHNAISSLNGKEFDW